MKKKKKIAWFIFPYEKSGFTLKLAALTLFVKVENKNNMRNFRIMKK